MRFLFWLDLVPQKYEMSMILKAFIEVFILQSCELHVALETKELAHEK